MEGDRAVAFDLIGEGDRAGLVGLLAGQPGLASCVDDGGMPLLHAAAQTGDPALVDAVLDAGGAIDMRASWGHTALEWAANVNARESAARLLERGSTLTLWVAAALGRLEDVRRFLTPAGSDSDGREPSAISDAFHIACRNGALDVARLLRTQGADVDALGYFDATEQGADVHRKDPEFDSTPAGWAREGGHSALARRLEQ